MTKKQYFEMCEMMGTTPREDEIPVELEDFPLEIQEAFNIYFLLKDMWEGTSGLYLGKDLSGILDIFSIMGVDDAKTTFYAITIIDRYRVQLINKKNKPKESIPGSPPN